MIKAVKNGHALMKYIDIRTGRIPAVEVAQEFREPIAPRGAASERAKLLEFAGHFFAAAVRKVAFGFREAASIIERLRLLAAQRIEAATERAVEPLNKTRRSRRNLRCSAVS